MRIKSLDIMGFKSFPERATIMFPEGISAVVGPNGCGKSNIVDAIRWVMGEQSAKQLRGRQMEDVLFNGSKDQSASGLAEVTLTLSNENGLGPGPSVGPTEISVTRRLYRSGDSDYLINKIPCRLKDITQFFMDTGMGTKAYSVIEQGRIGALVDYKPEERRVLVDEAAGITRYKAQKREAERKMEATEQNLIHINTLMSETKRQINSLTRAARKAARYKELKAELQGVDLALTAVEMAALDTSRSELSARRQELRTSLAGLLADLERMEVELEGAKLDIIQQEKTTEAKAADLYTLQNEFNTLRQEGDFLQRQTEENQVRRERMTVELAELGRQRDRQTGELARLNQETVRLAGEAKQKRSDQEKIRGGLNGLKGEHGLVSQERDELNRRLSGLRARLGRLEEIVAARDRMAESQAARREEIGAEIDQLRTEAARLNEQFETLRGEQEGLAGQAETARQGAAEHSRELAGQRAGADRLGVEIGRTESRLAGLNSRLATLKDIQANFGWYPEGVRALMTSPEMKEAGVICPVAEKIVAPEGFEVGLEAALGERLKFILVRDRRAAAAALEFLKANSLGRCGFISLADLAPQAGTDLVRALVGDYIPADNLAQALTAEPGRTVLTREGDYFGPGGLVVGGRSQDEDKGLLARRREIEELGGRIEDMEQEKQGLEVRRRETLTQAERIAAALAEAEKTARSAESSLIEVEKRLSAMTGRRGEIDGRQVSLSRALEGQVAEAERLAAEKEAALAERQALEDDEFDLAGKLEQVSEQALALAGEVEAAREREQRTSLEAGALAERLKTSEREARRTREWLRETEARTSAKEKDLAEAGEEQERLAARQKEISQTLGGFNERLALAEEVLARQKGLVDELRAALNAKETEARQSRRRRAEFDEAVRKVELDIQEIMYKQQAHVERIETEYRLDLTALPEDERPPADPDLDLDQARNHRDELRQKIESMGEVNLTAINEHEALKERYDFYRAQYDDLTAAVENLKQSISRINRTCKIRFNSTFKAVDEKLREIFPLLFDGGEAWLSLTDDSQPLDAGLEIHVHPPGKKLTVMSLLSGGEKALVALAFIFALYLIKPSPFCLLDEIDAPLDEANIDRFNRLLKKLGQSSQIIMITHNKRTMQISETLYGVTMEQPGISKMVSVNLSEIEVLEEDGQMVQAG